MGRSDVATMNADEVYGEYLRAQSENRPVPSVDPADALGESDKPGGTLSEKPDSSLGQGSSVNSATLPRPGPPIAGGRAGRFRHWLTVRPGMVPAGVRSHAA